MTSPNPKTDSGLPRGSKDAMSKYKTGDVVRTPEGSPFPEFAVVERAKQGVITVFAPQINGTSGYELAYEEDQLRRVGRIVLGKTYATQHGNRFVRAVFMAGMEKSVTCDVRTREGRDGAEETRVREIRRMALAGLAERGDIA